jgi:hypothetical protein
MTDFCAVHASERRICSAFSGRAAMPRSCGPGKARTTGGDMVDLCADAAAPEPAAAAAHPGALSGQADDAAISDWRGFHDALRCAALAATQSGAPLSLLLLEPGGAGRHRRAAGPGGACLQGLAGMIAAEAGSRSALARYAEERFAVIMWETGLGDAVARAERIGQCLGAADAPAPARPAIGVAQFRDDEALGHLIERTEDALERARADGALIALAGPRARSARSRTAWSP